MSEPSASPNPTPNPNPAPAAAPKPAAPAAKPAPMTRGDFLWLGWSALAAFFAASARPAPASSSERDLRALAEISTRAPRRATTRASRPSGSTSSACGSSARPPASTRCGRAGTHLGCTPNWWGDQNRFKCPCHGSNYTMARRRDRRPRAAPGCGARRSSSLRSAT